MIDKELALYVVTYYRELMTAEEKSAERHLATTFKWTHGRSDVAAQEELRREQSRRSRWLSDDPAVLRLAADGLEAFRLRTAARILHDHPSDVFLNYCPKCGGLTRTPQARLCLHCGYDWHHQAAV